MKCYLWGSSLIMSDIWHMQLIKWQHRNTDSTFFSKFSGLTRLYNGLQVDQLRIQVGYDSLFYYSPQLQITVQRTSTSTRIPIYLYHCGPGDLHILSPSEGFRIFPPCPDRKMTGSADTSRGDCLCIPSNP